MAYHADDTFLPSWGSGMRPREPLDADEERFTGFEDYPPKPKPLESPVGTEILMDHLTPYGTMTDAVTEKVVPKLRRLDRVSVARKSLFLLWWPAFLGTCIVASFGLRYWNHWLLAHVALFFVLFIGLGMIAIGMTFNGWPGKASMTFMAVNGSCIVFLALVSVFLGLYCFQTYTEPYEIYRGSQFYHNVVPSANPGAHRDAGIVEFAAGSRVDVEHGVGFRNGDYYCVAPIMGPESNGFSGFWAAGVNCCSARGGFRCGDVSDMQARSGLVVLDENYFGIEEIPEYTKAAEEASEQFAIGMPPKPIFVRWTRDANLERDLYLHGAFEFIIYAAAGLFVFMLVVVMTLSFMANPGPGPELSLADAFYSVEVYELDDAEARRRRGKKARKANFTGDPFLTNL